MNKTDYIFPKNTETGKIALTIDWSQHKLGEPITWPAVLRTTLSLILNSQFPMFISWGPDRILFYNDGYSKILGNKHPAAFEKKFFDIWSEIWDELELRILRVENGEAFYQENLKLIMNRFGYDEETYFTFSYSPIRDEDGSIPGFICTVVENTPRIIAERKLKEAHRQTELARKELHDFFMQAPPPMVVLLGPDHRFALANPPYERMVGREVLGKTVYEAFTKEEEIH